MASLFCDGSGSEPTWSSPHLELILGRLVPTHGDLPQASLSALSRTTSPLRQCLFFRVFRDLDVQATLDDAPMVDVSSSSEHARRAVRKLSWTLLADETCVNDNEMEEQAAERIRARAVCAQAQMERLGTLLSSLPYLTTLALTSHSHSPLPSLGPALTPSNIASLSNLSHLSLTGFTLPHPVLASLLHATPNLLSLTLQTFSPSDPTSASADSDPTPSPFPALPATALRHLQCFTGLASHVAPLLRGGQRSLRSLTVEMCGTRWEDLVRELVALPVRSGQAGLRELRITGVELFGGAEEAAEMLKRLGEVLSDKGGLEVLEVGVSIGQEGEGDVAEMLTLPLTHLSRLASLRALTLTTPSLALTSTSPSPPTSPTPVPLIQLSKTLPNLATLTINSTLWRFLRPDVVASARQLPNTVGPPQLVPVVALNGNKKLRRRAGKVRACESGSGSGSGSGSSEEE